MKLESLNNSKYSLTPEKMGQLVGGERIYVSTSACYIKGVKNSGDIVSYANERDQANKIESGPLYAFAGIIAKTKCTLFQNQMYTKTATHTHASLFF